MIFQGLRNKLTELADTVRAKSQKTEKYTLDEMITAIRELPQIDTSTATLDSGNKMLAGYTAFAKGQIITGTIETMESVSPLTSSHMQQTVPCKDKYMIEDIIIDGMPDGDMSITQSGNSITCQVTTAGYMPTTKSQSITLSSIEGATIMPSTNQQHIATNQYINGTMYVAGDANLIPENIINGKTIFGVEGNVIINKCYSGTTLPDASFGNDGDIYFMTEA